MGAPPPLTVHAFTRSGLVLTGLLLLAVGFGNMVAGRTKIAQYKDVLSVTSTMPPTPADPASLFPSPSEGDERSHLVQAKLAFYQLLLTAGQLLSAAGAALVGFGALRVWWLAAHLPADVTAAN